MTPTVTLTSSRATALNPANTFWCNEDDEEEDLKERESTTPRRYSTAADKFA